ncbi:TIGR01459 family HAD-type hydrolase [Hyphobacterium sp. HN65]|uniref:TIGR01459 family HAD-type hydrolase n=1 Tax=Hyphobacterium lacteum TaxID=3116575 RepID=A0ABU7LNA9_9PROT|nr:TIGR01459 family HAD-type hydrolase [Hyphobacterium sp. HN65]MEE2525372.1 TIGR01459 family HAD-type hydrolase [Hyphobacterium sp. HN65]
MKSAPALSAIIDEYSALFCDVWGVIRDGHALLPEAIGALQEARRHGKPAILVSNSPRPASDLHRQLNLMGAPDDAWDGIVTSGDATRLALSELAPGPFVKIGPPGGDDRLYDGLDIHFSDLEEARAIVCTGLTPEIGWDPEDYRDLLTAMAGRNLPMVCANPDIVVQVGDELVWCAGALARLYRELGGKSIISGKPHKPIYELAYKALEAAGWSGERNSVLAIGDGPETDIAGAERIGVDALFVGDGIVGGAIGGSDIAAAKAVLAEYGADARWFTSRLIW